ncbi:hypothetical protein BKA66DRAFT_467440 [Pyrenochaeta sp. MPI-SDFR-AT-0127]|nr:hypothetical protein BKA66DRAFT_467440 [Pyrenochaeta sp. MPI-SDFR-AT-0127]
MSISTENVTLWCTLIPRPGKGNELRLALIELAKKVNDLEDQCLEYQVIESQVGPDGIPMITFHLLERWTTEAALKGHNKREWLVSHRSLLATEQLLVGEESVQPVKVIGGFGARSVVTTIEGA